MIPHGTEPSTYNGAARRITKPVDGNTRNAGNPFHPTGVPFVCDKRPLVVLLCRADPRGARREKKMDGSPKIHGRIQYVKSFPDYKVQAVTSFPDLRVQIATSFPDQA